MESSTNNGKVKFYLWKIDKIDYLLNRKKYYKIKLVHCDTKFVPHDSYLYLILTCSFKKLQSKLKLWDDQWKINLIYVIYDS